MEISRIVMCLYAEKHVVGVTGWELEGQIPGRGWEVRGVLWTQDFCVEQSEQ